MYKRKYFKALVFSSLPFTLSALLLSIYFLAPPPEATALPQFGYDNPNQCEEDCSECLSAINVPNDWVSDGADPVYYYVHEDFASKFVQCNSAYTGEFSQLNATGIVKQAAEIWNTQARGPALIYGGWTDYHAQDGFCSDPAITRPAIHIDFRVGCKLIGCNWQSCPNDGSSCTDCNDSHCASSLPSGSIRTIRNCDDAMLIEIYADPSEASGCANNPVDWSIEMASTGGRQLIEVLLHEFGHAIGLGHPPDGLTTGYASMATASRRHLGQWDKDCVDDPFQSGSREVYYTYMGYSPGTGWSGPGMLLEHTQRGSIGNGHWNQGEDLFHSAYWTQYRQYPTWHQNYSTTPLAYFRWAHLAFNSPYVNDSETLPTQIQSLDGSPFFFHRRVDAPSGDGQRINYTWHESISTAPPRHRFRHSDDFFATSGHGDYQYQVCFGSTCYEIPMSSDVPLVAGYDPYTDTDILVWVEETNLRSGGHINILPGFVGTSVDTLRAPYRLSANNTRHTGSPGGSLFSYTFLTDFAPGVACRPYPTSQMSYNCILAWVDRVVPNGRIHYTYFRINSSKEVEWEGRAWTRAGTYTTSHVSAGYFSGSLWISWKHWTNPQKVGITRNLATYADWSEADTLTRPRIVDPPSFSYDETVRTVGAGARLTWTESLWSH